MLTVEQVANALLVLAVLCVLCIAGMGMWAIRCRRKAWEQYERERDARMKEPTSNADDFGGFPG